MTYFDGYLKILLIVKIIFVMLALLGLYVKLHNPNNTKLANILTYWKGRSEFIFISLMSVLFIYLFNPVNDHVDMIDFELKFMLFLFGFTLLLTENWYTFIHKSIFFKQKTK